MREPGGLRLGLEALADATLRVIGDAQRLFRVATTPRRASGREHVFFGFHADPDALAEVGELPAILEREMRALVDPPRRRARGELSRSERGRAPASPRS